MTAHDDRARDEQWIASTDRPDADIYDEQPASTARETAADEDEVRYCQGCGGELPDVLSPGPDEDLCAECLIGVDDE